MLPGPICQGYAGRTNPPSPPMFLISVASNRLRCCASPAVEIGGKYCFSPPLGVPQVLILKVLTLHQDCAIDANCFEPFVQVLILKTASRRVVARPGDEKARERAVLGAMPRHMNLQKRGVQL